MFGPMKRLRGKSTFTYDQRVYPLLESLESREPPSAFSASRLAILPLEEPFAAFREWQANPDNDVPMPHRDLVPKENNLAPAHDAVGGISSVFSSPTLGSFLAVVPEPGLAAAPAGLSSARPVLRSSAPVLTDLPTLENLTPAGTFLDLAPQSSGQQRPPSPPPFIDEFNAHENDDGTWTFDGHVTSNYDGNLQVVLDCQPDDGIPSVKGQPTDVNAEGYFTFSTKLGNCEGGIVTAQTTDTEGQASNVAEALVQQTSGCISRAGK